MLMEHPEGRRIHEAVLPGEFFEFGIAFVPQQRIPLSIDGMHMRAGRMAMRLLVFASRNLRDMGVHGPIGKNKADVHRAFSSRFKLVELEAREVMNEIRFPNVANALAEARRISPVIAIAFKMLGDACPIGKSKGVVKDEIEIVIEVESDRAVMRA